MYQSGYSLAHSYLTDEAASEQDAIAEFRSPRSKLDGSLPNTDRPLLSVCPADG